MTKSRPLLRSIGHHSAVKYSQCQRCTTLGCRCLCVPPQAALEVHVLAAEHIHLRSNLPRKRRALLQYHRRCCHCYYHLSASFEQAGRVLRLLQQLHYMCPPVHWPNPMHIARCENTKKGNKKKKYNRITGLWLRNVLDEVMM